MFEELVQIDPTSRKSDYQNQAGEWDLDALRDHVCECIIRDVMICGCFYED